MKKKALILSLIVVCLFIFAGCGSTSADSSGSLDLEKTNRYELLIGLNDVTTGSQILDTQKATDIVKKKLLDYVSGVTITLSNGHYYVGSDIVDEVTLNCVIYGSDDETIATLVKELNSELNVPVLVAKSTSDYRLIMP